MPPPPRSSSVEDEQQLVEMSEHPGQREDDDDIGPLADDDAIMAHRSATTAASSAASTHRLLYVSYFLAAWGDRMWEFAGVVFLLDLFPNNLLPASIFGLCASVCGILTGPAIGRYIDDQNRLKVIRTSTVGQNVVIVAAAVVYYVILEPCSGAPEGAKMAATAFFVLVEMIAKIFSAMNKISLHKDWIVVIGGGEKTRQASFNAAMRRVDLTCSIVAPLAVGLGSVFIGDGYTCIGIASWSFLSLFAEFVLNKRVYDAYPALHSKKPKERPPPMSVMDILKREVHQQREYYRHRAFRVSLPYCLLYCSVLSFAGVLVSFLKTRGVNAAWLAAGRGFAALVAIGSTVAIPVMVPRLGLWTSGRITSWMQVLCLTPLPVIFIAFRDYDSQSSTWFIVVIFISICTSRFGLWGFDLCETQLMQELIEPERAGVINGGQETLTNVCYVLSFLFTMIASNPDHFVWPVCLSYGSVLLAAILFTIRGQPPPVDVTIETGYQRAAPDIVSDE